VGYRTFLQLTAEVMRQVNSTVPRATAFDCQQGINDALEEVVQFHDWPFLVDRYDIALANAYSTGTVTATIGSTAVTGSGTTWSTGWFNKKILITGDSLEKEVALFNSPTSLTLRYPYNGTVTPTSNVGYSIYQDEYPVPISPGRDLMVVNPLRQRRIKRAGRYAQEDRFVFARYQQGTYPRVYADGGTDYAPTSPTYGQVRFKFYPPPFMAQDLMLIYFRNFTALSADTDTSVLPPEFEEVLIKNASYRVQKTYGIPGWMEAERTASRLLLQFRQKSATQTAYDYLTNWGLETDSDSYIQDIAFGGGAWPGRLS
jgi:hypothetical protein